MLGMLHDEELEIPKACDMVTLQEGLELSQNLQCQNFLECSALGGQNVSQVFVAAVNAAVQKRVKRKYCNGQKGQQCVVL